MKKIVVMFLAALLGFSFAFTASAGKYDGKKVLFIDSYHEGYAWSDDITSGVKQVLAESGVELKIIRMDTKRNKSKEFKQKAALKAKGVIEEFKPDVVIAADDNASKFLIVPHFKGKDLPFVFCGVNWDASGYGFPAQNVTGMIEVTPVGGLIDELKNYAKGDKVGFLGPDILTAHKNADNVEREFGVKLDKY